jgi:hypothetical protein
MSNVAILSAEQRSLLVAVLNRIIPPGDTIPGAGGLGVADPIEAMLAAQPAARRLFLDGLAVIEITALRVTDRQFGSISDVQRDRVLVEVERERPAFFEQLVSHTYRHYYVNPNVIRQLGLPTEPPQPSGRPLPPFDPGLLEKVRARGPVYRKV